MLFKHFIFIPCIFLHYFSGIVAMEEQSSATSSVVDQNNIDVMGTNDLVDSVHFEQTKYNDYKKTVIEYINSHKNIQALQNNTCNVLVRSVRARDLQLTGILLDKGLSPTFRGVNQLCAFDAINLKQAHDDLEAGHLVASTNDLLDILKQYMPCQHLPLQTDKETKKNAQQLFDEAKKTDYTQHYKEILHKVIPLIDCIQDHDHDPLARAVHALDYNATHYLLKHGANPFFQAAKQRCAMEILNDIDAQDNNTKTNELIRFYDLFERYKPYTPYALKHRNPDYQQVIDIEEYLAKSS